jgi:hypothetical protein
MQSMTLAVRTGVVSNFLELYDVESIYRSDFFDVL